MSGHKRICFCPDAIVTTKIKHVRAQMCLGTNMCWHNRVWAQSCVGTIVSGHKRVWAQSCLGTIVSGHNRVWAQSCLHEHNHVWAQSCLGTIVSGHNRVGSSMYGNNRVVSIKMKLKLWLSQLCTLFLLIN